MKKIKLFPAPHTEVRLHISDQMIKDYHECTAMSKRIGSRKDCDTCSWNEVKIGKECLCERPELMTKLMEVEGNGHCERCKTNQFDNPDRCIQCADNGFSEFKLMEVDT